MTEPHRARCPTCGLAAVRQISGGAGLIFKGTGFYITDYGKDGKGPRRDKETEPKPDTAATEAKPDPTTVKKEEAAPKAEKAEKSDQPDRGDKAEKSSRKKRKS
jgi:hypothetical protein